MEMKQCSRCFEHKPAGEYTANGPRLKARCRSCRAEVARSNRARRAGKPVPLPMHLERPVGYIRHLLKAYSPPQVLEVPVRARFNTVAYPRACTLRRIDGADWYCLASRRGERRLSFTSTGPLDLLEALQDLGLELLTPEVNRV